MKSVKKYMAVLVLGISTVAAAQDSRGFFVQAGLGESKARYTALQDGYLGQKTDKTGSLGVGYRLNDYFGIEAAYWKLGNLRITANTSGGLTGTDVGEIKALTAGGFVTLPIDASFELTVRAGRRKWQMQEEWRYSSGLNGKQVTFGKDGYGGIGAAYLFNQNMAVVMNLTRFKSPSANVKIENEIEVGLQYRFGR